jgi:hypothetical protein
MRLHRSLIEPRTATRAKEVQHLVGLSAFCPIAHVTRVMCDGSRANRLPSVLFSFFVKATNRKAIAVAQNDPLRLAARSIYDTV